METRETKTEWNVILKSLKCKCKWFYLFEKSGLWKGYFISTRIFKKNANTLGSISQLSPVLKAFPSALFKEQKPTSR